MLSPRLALDAIASHFERVPAGPAVSPQPAIVEPEQIGRRDFALSEPEAAARGLLGWRTVPRGHRDAPVLDVLADLLLLRPAIAALAVAGRDRQDGYLGRSPAPRRAARRAVLHPA